MRREDIILAEGISTSQTLDECLRAFCLAEAIGLDKVCQIKVDLTHPIYGPVVLTIARGHG